MKFDKSKGNGVASRDAGCYRKFLAGNKTLYTQAFWENGPRRASKHEGQGVTEKLLPRVEGSRN